MQQKNKSVAHLTSVHPRYDTRIFFKNCVALSNSGLSVSLVVADGLGNEQKELVNIIDVGKRSSGRLARYRKTTGAVFKKAIELDADIYHFHDPELIPTGLKLKKLGKKVIFDIHENVSLQIKSKPYIPLLYRIPISKIYRLLELLTLKKFDALILAEDSYLNYYNKCNRKCITVLNMPDTSKLSEHFVSNRGEIASNEIFYLGSITKERGFDIILDTMEILKNNNLNIKVNFKTTQNLTFL